MQTLEIRKFPANGQNWLASTGPFDALFNFHNRYRDIIVDNPDDPYGTPVYEGIAVEAGQHLEAGFYTFYWMNGNSDGDYYDE